MRLPSECPLALRLLGSRVARMGTRRARPHDVRCVIQRLHVIALVVQSWDAWALMLSRCSYDFNPKVCARLGSRSELQPADVLLSPSTHVVMFVKWIDQKAGTYLEAACHE